MTKLKFIWDEEEEEEEILSTKLKFTEPVETQFGIGAKAVGGATLPKPVKKFGVGAETEVPSSQFGISDLTTPEKLSGVEKGIISAFGTWEAQKRAMPELQGMEDLAKEVLSMRGINSSHEHAQIAYIYELLTTTETKAGVPMEETIKDIQSNLKKYGSISPPKDWKKAFKEEGILKTALIGPSEKYGKAESVRRGFVDIIIKKQNPGADFISSLGWAGLVTILGSQAVAGIMTASPIIKAKILNKEIKTKVSTEKAFKALRDISGRGGTSEQRGIFNTIIEQAKTKGISVSEVIRKGITITEVTPRFAFGTKLYAGLPADEIAKSIVEVGKVSADMVKGLDPTKVSQVTQQLLNINPALANEFLKVVEKGEVPEAIPKELEPLAEEARKPLANNDEYLYRQHDILDLDRLAKEGLVGRTPYESTILGGQKIKGEIPEKDWNEYWGEKAAKKATWGVSYEGVNQITKNPRLFFIKGEEPLYEGELTLRVKKSIADKSTGTKLVQDIGLPEDYHYTGTKTKKPIIPPELIEVKQGNKWIPLTDFYNQATAKPSEGVKVTEKVTEPVTEAPIPTGPKVEKEVSKLLTAEEKYPERFAKGEIKEFEKFITEEEKEFEKAEAEYPVRIVKEEVEELQPLATPAQIKKAHAIANSKAMISDKGKMKPQYREVAIAFTDQKSIKKMTKEEAEIFIDALNRLPEPKYRDGKLVPPSIPKTMKLTTEGFFRKKYGEPTPIWLLTDQTYYATKLGIKPLVEPFEKGKMEFDLEFRKSSNLVDRMVNKLNKIAKTPMGERIKSKVKNIPTKAESKMAGLLNKHEATPPGLLEKEEDVFKYFRNLSKDIWRRENEVREKLDLPPIKYKIAYFRHTADAMAKEMLEGKYPFPEGIKYWSEKMVGKKIFNPMEFQRKLSDDLVDLWSKDIRAVTKAMLWNGLKEIYLAQPAKFLNEQLNAISKDLPEYKNLTPSEQKAYEQTQVMPASTKKWLINYINQVIKGQETEVDASLNRIVTKSGLKGVFDKALNPFGRSIGRKPITNIFSLSGRAVISGVMGWVPRQMIRNAFQQTQNLALYGVKATIKSLLPASIDKNLKGLLSESLFLKSYTGFEELPADMMGKLEKIWLYPYGMVANNNAKQGMKAAYWGTLDLIKNPKFKKYKWADPQRTKDTPKGFLYPSEKEKLLKEMEFGASCTQYQYIPLGMPGIFRYKALIPFTRLQSWWMNYFTKFNIEAINRGLKGKPSWSDEDGPTLPWSRRVNYLKYLIIGGAVLTALGYRKSFMLGVAPTYLSPAGQVVLGFYNYAIADADWKRKKALNQIYYSWKAFIPGSLAWRDFIAVWNGEKELNEILFYGKKEKKKVQPPLKITIPKSGKLKFTETKIDIKSNKLKFTF